MRYLRRRGFRPFDVSEEKRGYDLLVGKRRIEVKSSTKSRAWMEVDIRKGVKLVKERERSITLTKTQLSFDEVIEVVRIGQPGGARIYHYRRAAVRRGTLAAKVLWVLRMPADEREEYRAR